MRHERLYTAALFAVFLVFAVLQYRWLETDQRPLLSEYHFFTASRIAHGWLGSDIAKDYFFKMRYLPYPPCVPYATAPWLVIFGNRHDVAALSLLPFVWLLMWSVWRVARRFCAPFPAWCAGILVLVFHHFVNIEPTYVPYQFIMAYLLDLPLSAFTALTLLAALRLAEDDSVANRLLLGVAVGLGALTRVNFALAAPVLLAALYAAGYRLPLRWRSLGVSALVALVIAAPWYAWHFADLAGGMIDFEFNPAVAAELGTPAIFSLRGLTYNAWLLKNMLTLPALLVVVAGSFLLFAAPAGRRLGRFAAAGLIATYIVLSLVYPKNPRLLAPFILFAALVPAGLLDLLRSRPAAVAVSGSAILFAAVLRVAGVHGYLPGYVDPSGVPQQRLAPDERDWQYGTVMRLALQHRDPDLMLRIGLNSYAPNFRHIGLQQYALENNIRLAPDTGWRLASDSWRAEAERCEFIVLREGRGDAEWYDTCAQFARQEPRAKEVAEWVRAQWTDSCIVGGAELPDLSRMTVYRNPRVARRWTESPARADLVPAALFDGWLALLSYDLEADGADWRLCCRWQALAEPPRDYRMAAQYRRGWRVERDFVFEPCGGMKPLSLWKTGLVVEEQYRFPMLGDPDGGRSRLWLGWYRDFERMKAVSRLPVRFGAVQLYPAADRSNGLAP